MTGDRQRILDAVRAALVPLPERAPAPEYEEPCARPRGIESVEDLVAALRERGLKRGYCDPELRPIVGTLLDEHFEIDDEFRRDRIDEYEFGITRASGAIEETGSVILRDAETPNRLGALAPWLHVACVPRDRVHRTLALALEAMGDDPNVVIVTGPSQTADVEGILIRGVHGPGEQLVFLH